MREKFNSYTYYLYKNLFCRHYLIQEIDTDQTMQQMNPEMHFEGNTKNIFMHKGVSI